MNRILSAAVLAALAAGAHAQILDVEPLNNTFAGATVIVPGLTLPYAQTGDLALTANDVDYLSLNLTAGSFLSVTTFPLVADYVPDTQLALFDGSADHLLLASNDDEVGGSGGSVIHQRITTTGTYYIGVSGGGLSEAVNDGGFTGTHNQFGPYQLTVSVSPQAVPEPASFAILGLGVAALVRRRNGAKQS